MLTASALPYVVAGLALVGLVGLFLVVQMAVLTAQLRRELSAEERFWSETYRALLASVARQAGGDFVMLAPKNARMVRVMADAALEQYRARWRAPGKKADDAPPSTLPASSSFRSGPSTTPASSPPSLLVRPQLPRDWPARSAASDATYDDPLTDAPAAASTPPAKRS